MAPNAHSVNPELAALAARYRMSVAELSGKQVHPLVLGYLAADYAIAHQILPLTLSATHVTCAIANPVNVEATDYLAHACGKRVLALLADPEELAIAIAASYAGHTIPIHKPEQPQKPKKVRVQRDRLAILEALRQ